MEEQKITELELIGVDGSSCVAKTAFAERYTSKNERGWNQTNMRKYFKGKIAWLSKEEGGREIIYPEGTKYGPVIKWKNGSSWSLFMICPDFSKTDEVRFTFLVDEAPYDEVMIGDVYDLHEGSKVVGRLTVTSEERREDLPVPSHLDECVANDDSFSERDWREAFEWISLSVSCWNCKKHVKNWLDAETM